MLVSMSNMPLKSDQHLRIPLVITPKLPHYATDPSNMQSGTDDRRDFIPAPGVSLTNCQRLQYVSIRDAQSRLISNDALPAVLHTYDDPAVRRANVDHGWTVLMNSLGYPNWRNVQFTNQFGDLLAERLRRLIRSVCSVSAGSAPEVSTRGPKQNQKGGINIQNAVLASLGAVGVLGLLGGGVYQSYRKFREDEDLGSFSSNSSEDVDVEVAQTRAIGFEEQF
eukprot:Gregarina_sp_Poly_1__10128@NODE_690_length_6749_cov_8_016761_g520_i0_p3_GENE_NODE_690_length_6749_cov_8_016761_g520_i0NODE_690_length_6749_cov_8_016761_g520_i0_p3_ORF_typecomplete_len223_score19_81_NODE_690_length_6749_cov_8_016761_g520_i035034171